MLDRPVKGRAFRAQLLKKANVSGVPKHAFGHSGHFRVSFAYADQTPGDGLAHIRAAIEKEET